jgi:Zn-dependent alcohol dehydrogenase
MVIVMGKGGIGMNAVQKRSISIEFGATHAVSSMEEATLIAQTYSNGQGADSCIVCVGVATGEHVAQAVNAIRKAGTCVLTGLPRAADYTALPISMRHMVLFQKRLQGSHFGASSPSKDIPALLGMYRQGRLKLEEPSLAATPLKASRTATRTCVPDAIFGE